MTPKGNSSAIVLQVDVRKKEKKKKKKRKIAYLALSTLTNDRNEPTTQIEGRIEDSKKSFVQTGSARYKSRSFAYGLTFQEVRVLDLATKGLLSAVNGIPAFKVAQRKFSTKTRECYVIVCVCCFQRSRERERESTKNYHIWNRKQLQ